MRRRFSLSLEGSTLEPRWMPSGVQQPPPYVDPIRPVAMPEPGDSGTPPGDYRPTDPGLC